MEGDVVSFIRVYYELICVGFVVLGKHLVWIWVLGLSSLVRMLVALVHKSC